MPSTTRYHIEWTRIDRQKNKHILYPKNTLVDVYTSPTSGVSIKGKVSFMGICETDAGTVGKVVSIPGFALVTGAHLTIKFTNGISVASPTLNVNNTGDKLIKYKGSSLLANAIRSNSFVNMVYDGEFFHVVAGQGGSYASKQTTKKFYVLGTPTDENGVPTAMYYDTGVYVDTVAGQLTATKFKGVHEGATVLSRVEKDVIETNPGVNRYKFEEFKNTSLNLPTAQWYHILSAMGSSSTYETRLAIGMSDDVLAFRRKQDGTWKPWRQVAHTGNLDTVIWNYVKPKTDELYATNVAINGTELQMTVPYVINVAR